MVSHIHKIVLFTFVVICLLTVNHGARILGVFPMGAPSHYILGSNYMRALAEAGHDVTMISPYSEKSPPKNGTYRDIVLTGFQEEFEEIGKQMDFFKFRPSNSLITTIIMNTFFSKMLSKISEDTLAHKNVQTLLNSNEQFDLVVIEQFSIDAVKGIAYHFQAPQVLFVTVGAGTFIDHLVGNPSPPSYIPMTGSLIPIKMSFFERTLNVLQKLTNTILTNLLFYSSQSKILKKYFPDAPELEILNQNYSIVLLNSHPSLHQAVPHVPAMVEIGGFHINPPKKLPKDLQEFLDSAKEGVIYFSMGSNLKSKNMAEEKRNALLRAFSKVKEKVLWKWEDDVLPGQPPNVKLGKWLPQSDILAHPNVKVFITHGGLLSTTEAVYHGVPVLAIPIFGDQKSNAFMTVENGFGILLEFESLSEEYITSALREILDNPKYRENAKRRSQVFHDRPQKPIAAAVYWTEYALRHPGAPHLKVVGAELPWYQYLLLDVFLFLITLCTVIIFFINLVIKTICCRRKGNSIKTKKD